MATNVNFTGRTEAMGKEGVKSPRAVENIGQLCFLMSKAKLTLKELSQRTGISMKALYEYRKGKHMPTQKGYNALAEVFGWEKEKPPARKKKKAVKYVPRKIVIEDAPPLPKPVKYEFEEGHMYRIYDGKREENDINVFKYEGKQGIHHCFREVRGGWTRTYTDAQLVGKGIKEV